MSLYLMTLQIDFVKVFSYARKLGGLDWRVDVDYVRDSADLIAIEKVYAHYDATKGAKITTYLSTLVHNEIARRHISSSCCPP